jgi:hypothetical protein
VPAMTKRDSSKAEQPRQQRRAARVLMHPAAEPPDSFKEVWGVSLEEAFSPPLKRPHRP